MANGWPDYDKTKYISRHGVLCMLDLSSRVLDIYVDCRVLDKPEWMEGGLQLYKREQVQNLRFYLGGARLTRKIAWQGSFAKLKRHLTRDECAPPSTWWYQARIVADGIRKPQWRWPRA